MVILNELSSHGFSLDVNDYLVVFMVIRCTHQVMYFVNLKSKGLALFMQDVYNSDRKDASIHA
jgi:hypothetical protein